MPHLYTDVKRFVFISSLMSFFILVAGIILFSFFFQRFYTHTISLTLAFFYVINIIVFYYQVKTIHQKRHNFTQVFMLTSGIKLLAYLVYALVIFYFSQKEYLPVVAITVLLFYIIFTLIELVSLTGILKRTARNGTN